MCEAMSPKERKNLQTVPGFFRIQDFFRISFNFALQNDTGCFHFPENKTKGLKLHRHLHSISSIMNF